MRDKNKVSVETYDSNIETVNIADACSSYMQIFGANTNLARHLPVVYDGLKIGERRILYTMYKMGLKYDGEPTKVASIVGNVLSLHPHGDSAVEDTMVKLAQPWNNIQCTITGSGNFGSVAGASAAAGRYIEAKLSYYAYKCFFEEYNDKIVNTKMNYLGTMLEPEFLPAKYPNVLINNVFGIGYGISTSICTYNLKEVLEATIDLMEDPNMDVVMLYPDSSSGAYVIDEGQFEDICRTGKGRFKMRGIIEIDEDNNILNIKSTPLMTSWEKLKRPIFELLNNGKVNLMRDFKDLCEFNNMHYQIFLKKEVDPYSVVSLIYSKTQMEKTFNVNFKLIEDWADQDYNTKSVLQTWIDFRREVKRCIFNIQLMNSKERQHILEILLFILNKDNAEKTMTIIKKSENKKEIISRLMKEYGISSLQAETIADMRMSAFSKESYKKYIKEKEEIDKLVEKLNKTVRSAKKIDKIIIDELKEGIKLFGEERRSKIITINNEIKVKNTNHIVSITKNGLIKKLPDDVKDIGVVAKNDIPIEIIKCNNTNDLLLFEETGKINKLSVYNVQGSVLSSEGHSLKEYCNNLTGEIVTVKIKPTNEMIEKIKDPLYFLMVTKNGLIKKTLVSAYSNIRNELLGMIIKDDDSLISVKTLLGDSEILVYNNKGFGIRFNSNEIKETGRMSTGVKSMNLNENEEIIGLDIMNPKNKYLLIITNNGIVKKSPIDTFVNKKRANDPMRIITLTEGDSIFTIRPIRGNEKFKLYLKNNIEIIDVKDIPELPRLSKGKRLIPTGRTGVPIKLIEM